MKPQTRFWDFFPERISGVQSFVRAGLNIRVTGQRRKEVC